MSQQIPILDLSQGETPKFASELHEAFARTGFVAIKNHGLSPRLRREVFSAIESFFGLPEKTKKKYFREGTAGARGLTPFGVEVAKDQTSPDLKEFFHVGPELSEPRDGVPENIWPEEVEQFRPRMLELFSALEKMGAAVLSAVARGLELAPDYFVEKTNRGNTLLRALHYPPVSGDAGGAVRAAAHEDINLITLLVGSEQPGLEVLSKAGEWVAAPGGDDLVVCNVGDMLQRLTNRVLSSTTHRVVNPPRPWCDVSRYSVPFFVHPNPDFVIETLPGCISDACPNRYAKPITAQEYLNERLREIGLLESPS